MKGRALMGLLRLPFTGSTDATRATSRAARPTSKASEDRTAILAYIQGKGALGATDDEIQTALNMPGDTQRPRRIELARIGCIEGREGTTRKTRSGKPAVVWYFKKQVPTP